VIFRHVIDDTTDVGPYVNGDPSVGGEQRYNGTKPRVTNYGAMPYSSVFGMDLIPMEQWPELIAKQEADEASAWHFARRHKLPVLDQNGLSYCHAFSAVWSAMFARAFARLPHVLLSSSSVGAPVTGYTNSGAYIEQDLTQMVKVGCASVEFVPERTTRKSDFKPGWEENAALHRVERWTDGDPGNYNQIGTALLKGYALANGRNFMSHAMVCVRLLDLKNGMAATNPRRYGVVDWNSWGFSSGDEGCLVFTGSRAWPDEFYIPEAITASDN
jgi:hypothetical protein